MQKIFTYQSSVKLLLFQLRFLQSVAQDLLSAASALLKIYHKAWLLVTQVPLLYSVDRNRGDDTM
jgi:hypothetical protein